MMMRVVLLAVVIFALLSVVKGQDDESSNLSFLSDVDNNLSGISNYYYVHFSESVDPSTYGEDDERFIDDDFYFEDTASSSSRLRPWFSI